MFWNILERKLQAQSRAFTREICLLFLTKLLKKESTNFPLPNPVLEGSKPIFQSCYFNLIFLKCRRHSLELSLSTSEIRMLSEVPPSSTVII